jgi:hypothetical protein
MLDIAVMKVSLADISFVVVDQRMIANQVHEIIIDHPQGVIISASDGWVYPGILYPSVPESTPNLHGEPVDCHTTSVCNNLAYQLNKHNGMVVTQAPHRLRNKPDIDEWYAMGEDN